MRYDDLYFAGVGAWYPKRLPVAQAIADGLVEPSWQHGTGQVSVTVADDTDGQPDMAVRAGRHALQASGLPPDGIGLLLHAVAVDNGLDGWNSAAYLQQRILGRPGPAFEIRQLSNGAVAGIELAASFLAVGTGVPGALITASDCFRPPLWDRWHAEHGLVFGDGASALVLSRTSGFARVLAIASVSDPELEGMQRGKARFRACPDPAAPPISLLERTLQFADDVGMPEIQRRLHAGLRTAVRSAERETGIPITDCDHVVFPHYGRDMLRRYCLDPLGVDPARTTARWAAHIGHVGAADQFGSLHHLVATGSLKPGQTLAMIGIGGGANWTCLLAEILTHQDQLSL